MTERSATPRGRQKRVQVKAKRNRSESSRRWIERQVNDPYVNAARAQGLRSRAAFKLIQLDEKAQLFRPGQRVVDLGAAPGGWTQVAVARTKAKDGRGKVVGIDLIAIDPIPGAFLWQASIDDERVLQDLREALGGSADLVLSDMAAATTGHRQTDHLRTLGLAEAAAEAAFALLAPGGAFVTKLFQGGESAALVGMLKQRFAQVRHVKPSASRAESAELYLVAKGYRPIAADAISSGEQAG